MHELSLALEILRIVDHTAKLEGARSVQDVFVEVGLLAGVMVSALEFCLEAAKKDSVAREATIHIDQIPGRGRCSNCDQEHPMESLITSCPVCRSGFLVLTDGDQLRVKEIEIEELD